MSSDPCIASAMLLDYDCHPLYLADVVGLVVEGAASPEGVSYTQPPVSPTEARGRIQIFLSRAT